MNLKDSLNLNRSENMCALDYIEKCFLQSNDQHYFDIKSTQESCPEDEIFEQFLAFIKKKMKFSVVKWESAHKEYPSHMFLGGDKGILAYVDFKYVESKEPFSDSALACDSKRLLETLRSADSQLDRPVFFVYMINCRDKQGIYFETNEQIKDRWFRNSFSSEYYVPIIDEMGDLNNLIALWKDLKKNNVRA